MKGVHWFPIETCPSDLPVLLKGESLEKEIKFYMIAGMKKGNAFFDPKGRNISEMYSAPVLWSKIFFGIHDKTPNFKLQGLKEIKIGSIGFTDKEGFSWKLCPVGTRKVSDKEIENSFGNFINFIRKESL